MAGRFATPLQQGSQTGFEQPAPSTELHRLFFALLPDDGLRQEMAARAACLRERVPVRGRWIDQQRYHLTLRFVGDFNPLPDDLIERLRRVGGSIRVPAFNLFLNQAGSFSNRAIPWWLGCAELPAGLRVLALALDVALKKARIPVEASPALSPHVTVLRDADHALPATAIEPMHWPVREFVLLDGRFGTDSFYHPLGLWRLQTGG